MKRLLILTVIMAVAIACVGEVPDNFVLVKGGTFKNTNSNYYGKGITVSTFYIDKYDVTQKEWIEVMGSNPSKFRGDNLPVETVSWYDSVEYCNRRSIKFGDLDTMKWTVTINAGANGYRLPTEAEWEYAAGGGQMSRSYKYSGSENVDEVAWYWKNSGDKDLTGIWYWPTIERNHNRTKAVGAKKPNELGLYDMSGDVRQWCWDWQGELETNVTDPKGNRDGFARVWKGGGWIGADFCCESAYRGHLAANGAGPDQGFRVCRGK
jgi:sulfatase modifying factor 1